MANRGEFDIAFDRIEAQLIAFSADDALIDATFAFTVTPDAYRYQQLAAGAYVFLYLSNLTPESRGSGRAVHLEYEIEYIMDLLVEHKGDKSGAAYVRADKLAGARLRYLQQQVILAMTDVSFYDLGFTAGIIGKRPLPRFEPLPPEIANQGETPLIGARAWMEVGMSFDPDRATGPDLEELEVNANLFTDLLEYGG